MFFNESLYLEDENLDVADTKEEMSDEEIEEAADSTMEDPIESSEEVVEESYEFMLESQEAYYNLREKVMKIEHTAIMKSQDGLMSEAAVMLSEAKKGFVKRVKEFIAKIKAKVQELIQRIMKFFKKIAEKVRKITGLKDPSKDNPEREIITGINGPSAIKQLAKVAQNSNKILTNVIGEASRMKDAMPRREFSSSTNEVSKDDLKEYKDTFNKELEKVKDMKDSIKSFADNKLKVKKVKITKSILNDKLKTVKEYNKVANDIEFISKYTLTTVQAAMDKAADAEKLAEKYRDDHNMKANNVDKLAALLLKVANNAHDVCTAATSSCMKIFNDANRLVDSFVIIK